MIKIERLLARSACRPSAGRTERLLIALKRRRDYRRCLKSLAAGGIKPVKTSPGQRIICCHAVRRIGRAKLKSHPDVAYVERDSRVKAHVARAGGSRKVKAAAASVPWNVDRVKAPPLWSRTRGAGVRVGVLDTGIARHPDLNVAGGVNTLGGRSFADDNGHGTHVAGIIAAAGKRRLYGNAPDVRLYAVKVLDAGGSGYVSDIIEGIDWCLARGIRVLNMSFGMSADNRALRDAIRRARRRGAVIVASAGNSGTSNDRLDAPARYPETIAVAATTSGNRAAPFSSRGNGIEVAAPGVNILSTWRGGTYRRLSGTSMSAPHVTGGAALLRALSPNLSAARIASRFKSAARRIPGGSPAVGSGLLQTAPSAYGLAARSKSKRRHSK